MKIAIAGSGNVGTALGRGWLRTGHQVVFSVRDPESPKARKALEMIPEARLLSPDQAFKDAEVIVLTVPPESVLSMIDYFGDVSGKVIIDATNSIRTRPEPYPTAYHAVKALTGSDMVVKCFNSTGYENMLDPVYDGTGIDMFAAGDNKSAKEIATRLAKDIGFATCYDFGGDDKVELLEKFALSWINIAIMQGHGRNLAFKLLKR